MNGQRWLRMMVVASSMLVAACNASGGALAALLLPADRSAATSVEPTHIRLVEALDPSVIAKRIAEGAPAYIVHVDGPPPLLSMKNRRTYRIRFDIEEDGKKIKIGLALAEGASFVQSIQNDPQLVAEYHRVVEITRSTFRMPATTPPPEVEPAK